MTRFADRTGTESSSRVAQGTNGVLCGQISAVQLWPGAVSFRDMIADLVGCFLGMIVAVFWDAMKTREAVPPLQQIKILHA